MSPRVHDCAAATAADYLHVLSLSQQMLFDSTKTNEKQRNIYNPLCKTVILSVSSRY